MAMVAQEVEILKYSGRLISLRGVELC